MWRDVLCGKVKLIRKKIATWLPRNRPAIENLTSKIPTPTRGVEGLPELGGRAPWKETARRLNLEVAPLCGQGWPAGHGWETSGGGPRGEQ